MKKYCLFFIFLLIAPIAFADITIQTDQNIYNLGNKMKASVSVLQRKLRLGYGRAARIVDMMEQEGIVGPYQGSRPREILIDRVPEDEPANRDS